MSAYKLSPLSPISPLSFSISDWGTQQDPSTNLSSNSTSPSCYQHRIAEPATSRLTVSPAPSASGHCHFGPRPPRLSTLPRRRTCVLDENQSHASRSKSTPGHVRRLPATPLRSPSHTRDGTLRPLPQPPIYSLLPLPSLSPLPSPARHPRVAELSEVPELDLDGIGDSGQYELTVSKERVLRLSSDTGEPGIVIVSPITLASSFNDSPPLRPFLTSSREPKHGGPPLRVDTFTLPPPLLTKANEPFSSIVFAHTDNLSPSDCAITVSPREAGRGRMKRRTGESKTSIHPLGLMSDEKNIPPTSPTKGHKGMGSDLSKKLKRFSNKWIREKKGRRWVEEDYGRVLRKLRTLR